MGTGWAVTLSLPAVRYAFAAPMSGLVACPFCRAMFERGEQEACPECGLGLQALSKLPPSYDATVDDEPIPPHMETLPWSYLGRARGPLVAVATLGLLAFFAPWASETAPDLQVLTGIGFARKLGWMWAPAVAWFVMIPLVLSRRSIHKMRGARVAVGFLAGIVLTTVAVRLFFTPKTSLLRPVRFEWEWGLYVTGALGMAGLALATMFGGRLDDVPTTKRRRGDETLH